ncbi:unnamed protein product [Rotaria sp. Silwood2]|nr:unnamed protein product [Rotaria sp. Silwood2]
MVDMEVLILLTSLIEKVDRLLFDGSKSNVFVDNISPMEQFKEEKEQENLETYTLLWCDAQVNTTDDNRQTQIELRQSINFLKTFESADLCKLYIERKSNEEIILIVSGCIGRNLVPDIHDLLQVIAIYVFCLDLKEHEVWTKDYEKIKKVTSGRVQLLDSIMNDQIKRNNIARKQHLNITVFSQASMRSTTNETIRSSREYSHQNLDCDFMWSQLIVEVLLKMTETTRQNYFNLFMANCRKQYNGNANDLKIVDELEEYYDAPAALYWYTRDSFLYRTLNRALRCRDDHTLVTLSFFIHDIYNQLKSEQTKSISESAIVHVYRGQLMSTVELEKMKINIGKFISMNSFFSTTINRQLASEIYAGARSNNSSLKEESVLFDIEANTCLVDAKPFADISRRSAFDKEEQEILFMLGSIFKIIDVSRNEEEKLWIVKLELTNEEENDLKLVFKYMKNEIPDETDLLSLGNIYYHMGKYFEAERYFQNMLNSLSETDQNLAGCYSNLGMIAYYGYGDYEKARSNYSKALELELQKPLRHKYNLGNIFNNLGNVLKQQDQYDQALLQYSNIFQLDLSREGSQGLLLAAAYLNIGIVYNELRNYNLAVEHMNECLAIEMHELPKNHPKLATTLNYIALAQQNAREYEISMINFQKALSIQLVCMPDHPETAITYNNIGMGYVVGFENYTEALLNYEKALKIYENASIKSNHPALVSLLTNIGFLHRCRDDYHVAMEYYERALKIQLECQPNHSTTGVIYKNIGLIYERGFQNYNEALINYKKAIEIFRISLPADHPDLAKTLSSMADLYSHMDEYEMALINYKEALKSLSISAPNQPAIIATYIGIGLAYSNGFRNYIDALVNLEKALNIYKTNSLPEEISSIQNCIHEIEQRLENEDPLSYPLAPNQRYSMRQILGDGELLTNGNPTEEHILMSDLLKNNTAIGLYFVDHSSFGGHFTLQLADIYNQMFSNDGHESLSFDIIYIWLYDLDKQSFNEHYKEMPWKSIPYREQDSIILINRLDKYFDIQRIPTLIILNTSTGEILANNGYQIISQMKLNAIESWCCGKKVICPRLPDEEFVWYHVYCDGGCNISPLRGLRYHCNICADYDLCVACKERKEHEHELQLLKPSYENEEEY